jgi:hypothetical protein
LWPLYAAFAVAAAGLLVYSQTMAFHWDEGFHILTAYLIRQGKRPYLDFFFPQTPLNAYWNAAWIALFGPSWRAVHAVAALATLGSVVLIAQYLFELFPPLEAHRRWKPIAALAALGLFGLHSLVWEFGAISQAYPLGLLLVTAAFRFSIVAVDRPRGVTSALAGLAAGGAAASTLLTAAASPVLLVWMWRRNRAGRRWSKAAAFVASGVIAFLPLLLLLAHGPFQVTFDVLKYHSLYRRVEWKGATAHDIEVVTDWFNSSQSLLLVLLAAAGCLAIIRRSRDVNPRAFPQVEFDPARRPEFYLSIWLVLAICAQNSFAHPTFPQYFIFTIPFLTVLAVIGFYAVATRLAHVDRPMVPALVLLSVAVLCVGNTVYGDRDQGTWLKLERAANKIKQVTPAGAPFVAPEQFYFLLRSPVPPGMEHDDAHKLRLSAADNARLHVLPKPELDQQIKSGDYPTVVVCDDDDRSSEVDGWNVFAHKEDIDECTVFWGPKKRSQETGVRSPESQ